MVAHAAGRLPASKLVSLWGIRRSALHRQPARDHRHRRRRHVHRYSQSRRHRRRPSPAGPRRHLDRLHRQPEPRNHRRQSREWLARRRLFSRAARVRCRSRTDLRPRPRRIPYSDFHTGYKKNALAPDELLYAIHIPRRFAHHRQYLRKVGTRRAMAIAKVALGATALVDNGIVTRNPDSPPPASPPFPTRLFRTEDALCGKTIDALSIAARAALLAEVLPIDDIRSTAEYRRHVAANLLEEFLNQLRDPEAQS